MSRFRKKERGTPEVSTASLPDIVFMLLFFFMVTTVMREVDLKVKIVQPEATEIQKLEKKALVDYIFIGPPMDDEQFGTEPVIQLDDAFAELKDIRGWIVAGRTRRAEAEIPLLTTSLKVDQDVKMGIITDVKQQLRKENALKINYSTLQRMED